MKSFDHQSGAYFKTGGAEIYYEIIGKQNGPVILLLHSGFGTMNDFDVILEELTGTYKIIGIDSRGQGRSTMGSAKLTYEQIQNDVLDILQHLKVSQLSIIGFSDGGIVGYRLAALSELKIDKLVTVSSRWNINDALRTKDTFLQMTPESAKDENRENYKAYQELNPEANFDLLVSSLVKMWLDPNASGYLNEDLKTINCPLLIVHGDDDILLTKSSVVELSQLIKASHLLNIPFATHPAIKDQQQIFMISLRQFLES